MNKVSKILKDKYLAIQKHDRKHLKIREKKVLKSKFEGNDDL